MKRNIINKMSSMCLASVFLLGMPHAMAQKCQVITSRSEVQLGNQLYDANKSSLFTSQVLNVTVACNRTGPVNIMVEGNPDEGGKYFRFGEHGRMELSLLSANYNNAGIMLTVISPERGSRQFTPGQTEPLFPGSQIILGEMTGNESELHPLILQLRLDFPVSNDVGLIRDKTEMKGQLQFEATQME